MPYPRFVSRDSPRSGPRVFSTAQGSRLESFGWVEWVLLCGIALIWGSSFLLIEVGLESLEPGTITWVRVTLGFLALTVVPAAREPVDRADYPRVVLLGFVWVVVPFVLFPIAQQHIDSALTGMPNASVPIFSTVIAIVLLRSLPRFHQAAGIVLGLAGTLGCELRPRLREDARAGQRRPPHRRGRVGLGCARWQRLRLERREGRGGSARVSAPPAHTTSRSLSAIQTPWASKIGGVVTMTRPRSKSK